MSAKKSNKNKTLGSYVRTIGPFDGVNTKKANSDGAQDYLEYTENLWKDPAGDGISLDVVPGFRRVTSAKLDGKVYGIWQFQNGKSGKKDVAVHAGSKLYIYPAGNFSAQPYIVSGIAQNRSSGVGFDGCFMLFDGTGPRKIVPSGTSGYTTDTSQAAYIPTVYLNGYAHEKKNLLSEYVYEKCSVPNAVELSPSNSLIYSYDRVLGHATVIGVRRRDELIYISKSISVDGREFTVTGIEEEAFKSNAYIKALFIDSGITVGKSAFENCSELKFVAFLPGDQPGTVTIGEKAFFGSPVKELYLTDELNSSAHNLSLGSNAFGCGNGGGAQDYNCEVYYNNSATVFSGVSGYANVCASNYTRFHGYVSAGGRFLFYSIPVIGDYSALAESEIDGDPYDSYTLTRGTLTSPMIKSYMFFSTTRYPLEGLIARSKFKLREGENIDLTKCRLACLFDDRIFLSGYTERPGAVFYSGKRDGDNRSDPLFFPKENVFYVGADMSENRALLSTPSALIVLKGGRDGAYYMRSRDGSGGKVEYSALEGAERVGTFGIGSAVSVGKTLVTASPDGVYSVNGSSGGNKQVSCDTADFSDISSDLKRIGADPEKVSLCTFLNYTVLAVDGTIYLCDRDSESGWYKLCGIGVCEGQHAEYVPVCRDTDVPLSNESKITLETELAKGYDGFTGYYIRTGSVYRELYIGHDRLLDELSPAATATATPVTVNEIFSRNVADNSYHALGLSGTLTLGYYPEIGEGRYYLSEPDGAMAGGSFDGCCYACEIDGTLYFGTGKGYLCAFNTDKRGKQVYRIDTAYEGGKNAVINSESKAVSKYTGNELYYDGEALIGGIAESNGFSDAVLCMPYGDGYALLCKPEREILPTEIHPYYYAFDGRSIFVYALSGKDDFGESANGKSTVSGSVIAVMSDIGDGAAVLKCRTEKVPFFAISKLGGTNNPESTDFAAFSFVNGKDNRVYGGLSDDCRGYMWKQYHIGGRCFRTPFGITMLSCRYKKRKYRAIK